MNLFSIAGRIIDDPVVSEASNGTKLAKLKVAVDKQNVKDNELEYEVFEVTVFKDLATKKYDVNQFVCVDGRISSFKQEKDGNVYYNLSLVGNHISLLGK